MRPYITRREATYAPITTATKLATLQHNGPSARAQPVKAVSMTGSERWSTDGAAAYWRPSKYSSSEKLPRDWLQLATK